MKKLLFLSFVILSISVNCNYSQENLKPKNVTIINLDESLKEAQTAKVYLKSIYPSNDYSEGDISEINECIFGLRTVVEGNNGSFFALNQRKSQLIQFDKDFHYIKSIGKPGNRKNEFNQPYFITGFKNNIHICDDDGKRVQKYDGNGKFIKEITKSSFMAYNLALGKNSSIITYPASALVCFVPPKKGSTKPSLTNLLSIWDSSITKEKIIAPLQTDDTLFFRNKCITNYKILASENSKYIWIILPNYAIIRKYDYNGNFVEEINFSGKLINKELTSNKMHVKHDDEDEGPAISMFTPIFEHVELTPENDLLINVIGYGNITLSGNEEKSSITKKYEFVPEPNTDNLPPGLILKYLHNKKYVLGFREIYEEIEK